MKILVVDDDPDTGEMLRFILFRSYPQHEIYIAKDGVEATEIITAHQPNIFIIDLYMPYFDGFRLLEALSINPNNQIMVISSCNDTQIAKICTRAGANFFASKPIRLRSFMSMIDSLMENVFLKRLQLAKG